MGIREYGCEKRFRLVPTSSRSHWMTGVETVSVAAEREHMGGSGPITATTGRQCLEPTLSGQCTHRPGSTQPGGMPTPDGSTEQMPISRCVVILGSTPNFRREEPTSAEEPAPERHAGTAFRRAGRRRVRYAIQKLFITDMPDSV